MPRETAGKHFLSNIDRATQILYDIYEKFVAAFYKRYLADWHIWSQQMIRWPTKNENTSNYLPVMKPDLTIQHRESGRMVILDTKFTKKKSRDRAMG